jgi:hypothetical protein
MHRQVRALDARELGLDLLLGRVDDHGRLLPENQLLDLDEAEHLAVADLAGVDLEDLALAVEDDLENVTGGHRAPMLA